MTNLAAEKYNEWTTEITPKTNWWVLNLKEVWGYRDLLMLFVRRDFVKDYKQTILGPLWFFIQPILSTLVFTVIFGAVAGIPTDGVPKPLFYLAGITAWTYFADCLTKTSSTFTANQGIFGKVYFPRLVTPLSIVISNVIKFGIQFVLFLGFLGYYWLSGVDIRPNSALLLFPVLILIMGGLGLGFGIIVSSMTTKYRDLQKLVDFGVRLMMYGAPVAYPLSLLLNDPDLAEWKWAIIANPMTPVIETFKYAFIGQGTMEPIYLLYSFICMVVILLIGLIIFHRVEKNFMDTV